VPPCELHALLYGVVALPFLPVSAALFAETFEPSSRELYPERKAMRRGVVGGPQGCGFAANKRVGTVLTFLELCSCTYRLILPALLS
jgi:hypothetical protein